MLRRALFGFLILSPILAIALADKAGLRFNHTESFPAGIYWASAKHPEKSDLVSFRPPALPVFDLARECGYIERDECMLKRLVAIGGDVVRSTPAASR
jgi:type IV secretory pathway protease TraF